jgi:hypothetical protein
VLAVVLTAAILLRLMLLLQLEALIDFGMNDPLGLSANMATFSADSSGFKFSEKKFNFNNLDL